MKAIVMAGGDGTRLRPLSSNHPKPMVKLLDRPVLEYILRLLRKNGVEEMCLTLKYLPHIVTDYLRNSELGAGADYRIEKEALGTAGGVKACKNFIGDDDFLVISGDCITDFDLKKMMEFHRERGADVTIALNRQADPLEYGLVVTRRGRIESFIEKPSWDRVVTDLVNTGIYIIRADILNEIPDGVEYDFGKNLFPLLLQKGYKLYGCVMEGYWCDIGNAEALLGCAFDALDGKPDLICGVPEVRKGIWSKTEIPSDATINGPVFIGENVTIEKGAVIGPYAVIGSGSVIERGATVRRSCIDGALIRARAEVYGSFVCGGAVIGTGSEVRENCVIGENCVVGSNCVIKSGTKIWPDREIPDGEIVKGLIVHNMPRRNLTFSENSAVKGKKWTDITPEACLVLGSVAAGYGKVGLARGAGDYARLAAKFIGGGICATGGELIEHDALFETAAAFASEFLNLPLSIFVRESEDEVTITFFDGAGCRLTRAEERKMESKIADFHWLKKEIGSELKITGVCENYRAHILKKLRIGSGKSDGTGPAVSVGGGNDESLTLESVLLSMGADTRGAKEGAPVFTVRDGGEKFECTDENGTVYDYEHCLALLALLKAEGGAREACIPASAPAQVETLLKLRGVAVSRAGKDSKNAPEVEPEMRDGILGCALIYGEMQNSGESLGGLFGRVPEFSVVSVDFGLKSSRAAVMRELTEGYAEMAEELVFGLRVKKEHGVVEIVPSYEKDALSIRGEGDNAEFAEEICAEFQEIIRLIDEENTSQ